QVQESVRTPHRMTIVRVLGSEFLLYHFGIKAVIIPKYHGDTN
ncbi:hypothetical protein HMPREF2738_00349, partial [Clostridiales bacterium KLE1615]